MCRWYVLQPHHVEIQYDQVKEQRAWSLPRCGNLGCACGVMYNSSNLETGELSSNSSRVYCIDLQANTPVKSMNPAIS